MARPKRQEFDPKLAEFRRQARLTQEDVAERMGISTETIRRHERGLSMPIPTHREQYCKLYGATQVQLGLRMAIPQARVAEVIEYDLSADEDVSDILSRVQKLTRSGVGAEELACFELAVDDLVARYEGAGPVRLAPLLTAQRLRLERAIDDCRDPKHRQRLFRVAGQTSGLLGYVAVNRGRFPLARAYCVEATNLGRFADDDDLLAWVKGTESFCEYYAGDYARSFELAREGQQLAGSGPQSVRLIVNGEARALGKLGDVRGVHTAVERAYDVLDKEPDIPGVSPCVSFGGYSRARLASNAVTAYVDLGRADDVAFHAGLAMDDFESSESSWSQSLIRLDLANSLARAEDGDPAEASDLVVAALNISSGNPIASVVQRSRSFVRSTTKWRGIKAVDEAHEIVRTAAKLG